MTRFQQIVLSTAAAAVALRFFFPLQYETRFGPRTDFFTTLLHVVGILVVATALVVLVASPDPHRLRKYFPAFLLIGWIVYLLAGVAAVSRYGIPRIVSGMSWLSIGLALEVLFGLLFLTGIWLSLRFTASAPVRRKWLIGLGAVLAVGGLATAAIIGQRSWQLSQAMRAEEQAIRNLSASTATEDESIALVRERFGPQIRAALAGAGDDFTLRGWEARALGGGRYLVSYTFTLPEQELRGILNKDPSAPPVFLPCSQHLPAVAVVRNSNVLGWWWEVTPPEKSARAVNDTAALLQTYKLQSIEGHC